MPLPAGVPVGTGCLVIVSGPSSEKTYSVLVMGDVRGTGRLDIAQLVCVARDLNGTSPLTGLYKLAAKLTGGTGPVNIADLVMLAQKLLSASNQ